MLKPAASKAERASAPVINFSLLERHPKVGTVRTPRGP